MTQTRQDLAFLIAQGTLDGFNRHYRLFRETSRHAKTLFEAGDWREIQRISRSRIAFYDRRVTETVEYLRRRFRTETLENAAWQQVKLHYVGLLANHRQPELAETFFNTVSCRILHRSYYHNDFLFVRPALSTEHIDSDPPTYRSYYPAKAGLRPTLRSVLEDFGLRNRFEDLARDLRQVLRAVRKKLPRPIRLEANHQVQVLSSLFFRNKGAYAIGKIVNGDAEHPFAVAILRNDDGSLYLDAILLEEEQLSILFGFSRAYFMVDMEVPSGYVQFLRTLLPRKPVAELYTMLGLQKQGKTLFYRDFLQHLRHSSDAFVIAPGIRGLVMLVFTLPSYPYVFKVIKDAILPPKEITREEVKRKYLLVKHHDRVGRMADTLEFKDVALPRDRFSPELLEELRALAPSVIEEEGDTVIVRHLYVERRMIPLNIHIDTAPDEEVKRAVEDYCLAVKQLAAANIFPGDMLFKNFGVTRYGRVVFYDYDEIAYMTECNFRRMPAPRTPEDELSAEPWYPVARNDVFPEEFAAFLLSDPRVRGAFVERHADLLSADYWNAIKRRIAAGHVEDVFPYPESMRFGNRAPRGACAAS
ncbi:MAG TPA: bifunctional isocitrate dehydrogenase kinase/phosphatase [Burkholderiales bacterium]|nr:bifunctional isocitrate dehydrogenase kinase/phosphatase [Burkholderiales bacterium]